MILCITILSVSLSLIPVPLGIKHSDCPGMSFAGSAFRVVNSPPSVLTMFCGNRLESPAVLASEYRILSIHFFSAPNVRLLFLTNLYRLVRFLRVPLLLKVLGLLNLRLLENLRYAIDDCESELEENCESCGLGHERERFCIFYADRVP